MSKTKRNRKAVFVASSAMAFSLMTGVPVMANTTPDTAQQQLFTRPFTSGARKPHGVMGVVTGVSGTTVTLKNSEEVVYTITTGKKTKIIKAGATIAVSSIAVGDSLLVHGSISGSNVNAKIIIDGEPTFSRAGMRRAIRGNVSFGTITQINGVNFTIDARHKATTTSMIVTTDATTVFKKDGATGNSADLAVGSRVVVIGPHDMTTHTISPAASVNVMTKAPAPRAHHLLRHGLKK